MNVFLLSLAMLIQTPAALQAQTGAVTGMLRTSPGTPIADTRVALVPADGSDSGSVLQGLTQTDNNGKYRIENILPGRYHIMTGSIGSPLYHPGVNEVDRATSILVYAGSVTQVPDFVFWRTRVSGRVVDATTGRGRRIETLMICCEYSPRPTSGTGSFEASYSAISAHVNDDGTFEFPEVPAGKQDLQVVDPGFVSFARPITIADKDITGLELRVSSERNLRGTILDQTGRPVSAVTISLKPKTSNEVFEIKAIEPPPGMTIVTAVAITGPGSTKATVPDVRSDLLASITPRLIPIGPNGTFMFPKVLPGGYFLEISAPGGKSTKREVEVSLQGADIRIELPFTQLSGRIVPDDGGVLPPVTGSVKVFGTAANAPVLYCFPDAEGRFFALLDSGEYRVVADSLIPGHDVLSISDGTHDLRGQPFVFDARSLREIQITIER